MGIFRIFLLPLTWIYSLVVRLRNMFYDTGLFKAKEFGIPLIIVGNLSTGGTGKTPHILFLIDILKEQGYRPAVLSRGYKRKTSGHQEAGDPPSATKVGDEPALIKARFPDVPVVTNGNRAQGIRRIKEDHEDRVDVILLDDGFQHRKVRAGLNILLTDHNNMYTEDHLLPYGNLREPRSSAKRADIIIVTKTPEDMKPLDGRIMIYDIDPLDHQEVYFSYIDHGALEPVFPENKTSAPQLSSGTGVVLLTGIADASPLMKYLEKNGCEVKPFRFPDHHWFSDNDIKRVKKAFDEFQVSNRLILTTEKDAMRLRDSKGSSLTKDLPIHYLKMDIRLHEDEEQLKQHLNRYVKEDQRHDRVYPK